jgi:exosortase/archaeosortase family protein
MDQQSTSHKSRITSERKLNLFYILAFLPIIAVAYFSLFSAVIPVYGLLLLLMKGAKLNETNANLQVKLLGLAFIAANFFVYYAVIPIYPNVAFYGVANYVVYLLGLLLLFFGFAGVKTGFTSLFLTTAATSSAFIADWLKPFITPYVDEFANIIIIILTSLGLRLSVFYLGRIPIITFTSIQGHTIAAAFVYECIGVYSALVFSIILVVILLEDPSTPKNQVIWSIAGVVGTFALNILRVTIILLTDYFYGAEAGANVHYIIGYALFSIWLVSFLLVYSKRHILRTRITVFLRRGSSIQTQTS